MLQLSRKGALAGSLIGLMVALVIGIAVTFNVVQQSSSRATTIYSMANDTFNASTTTNNNTLFKGFNDGTPFYIKTSTLHLYNMSDCTSDEYTYNTHFVIKNNGTSPYLNLTNLGNIKRTMGYTCAVYDYYDSTYVQDSMSRTILRLLPLMVVVVLLVACASLIA